MVSKNVKVMILFFAALAGTIYLVKKVGKSSCQYCSHQAPVNHAHDHDHDHDCHHGHECHHNH